LLQVFIVLWLFFLVVIILVVAFFFVLLFVLVLVLPGVIFGHILLVSHLFELAFIGWRPFFKRRLVGFISLSFVLVSVFVMPGVSLNLLISKILLLWSYFFEVVSIGRNFNKIAFSWVVSCLFQHFFP